jgi:hypothetical protein
VGLFDRLKRRPPDAPAPPLAVVWHVYLEGAEIVAENGSTALRVPRANARAVRIVPLMRGNHHAPGGGYQVAIACADGDAAVGGPIQDWRSARALAQQVCAAAELQLDELTERLFSRVGTLSEG